MLSYEEGWVMRIFVIAVAAILSALGAPAFAEGEEGETEKATAQAGLFANSNRENLPKLTLSAGEPLLKDGKLLLKSGKYYEIEIEADGSQELAISGSSFFRSVWIDEIVINGIEIRPLGIDSLEFDDAGTAEISFIAIKPGTHSLSVPGSETQKVEIIIE
jgi:hypothetical protein